MPNNDRALAIIVRNFGHGRETVIQQGKEHNTTAREEGLRRVVHLEEYGAHNNGLENDGARHDNSRLTIAPRDLRTTLDRQAYLLGHREHVHAALTYVLGALITRHAHIFFARLGMLAIQLSHVLFHFFTIGPAILRVVERVGHVLRATRHVLKVGIDVLGHRVRACHQEVGRRLAVERLETDGLEVVHSTGNGTIVYTVATVHHNNLVERLRDGLTSLVHT